MICKMKKIVKRLIIRLPRKFRIWWSRVFIYMLGGNSEAWEITNDITLYNELRLWVDKNGRPNKN